MMRYVLMRIMGQAVGLVAILLRSNIILTPFLELEQHRAQISGFYQTRKLKKARLMV